MTSTTIFLFEINELASMTVYRMGADAILLADRICAAPGCCKPVIRRKGEDNCDFKERKTCGAPECKNAMRRSILVARNTSRRGSLKPRPERTCTAPGCDNPIVRRDREVTANFRKRLTCSLPCAYKLRSHTMNNALAKGLVIPNPPRKPVRSRLDVVERPTERQILEYLNSGEAARRLFEPHIAEAARKRAGHADCLAVEGPPDDSGGQCKGARRIGAAEAAQRGANRNLAEARE